MFNLVSLLTLTCTNSTPYCFPLLVQHSIVQIIVHALEIIQTNNSLVSLYSLLFYNRCTRYGVYNILYSTTIHDVFHLFQYPGDKLYLLCHQHNLLYITNYPKKSHLPLFLVVQLVQERLRTYQPKACSRQGQDTLSVLVQMNRFYICMYCQSLILKIITVNTPVSKNQKQKQCYSSLGSMTTLLFGLWV